MERVFVKRTITSERRSYIQSKALILNTLPVLMVIQNAFYNANEDVFIIHKLLVMHHRK
jgi:hypothetical protein